MLNAEEDSKYIEKEGFQVIALGFKRIYQLVHQQKFLK